MKTVLISFLLVAVLFSIIDIFFYLCSLCQYEPILQVTRRIPTRHDDSIYANEENCTDFEGQSFAHGLYYVPGPSPNVCSYCVCHHGSPMWCKSIFCRAPYKCRPVHNGPRCCDFTCLEEPRLNVTKSTAAVTSSSFCPFIATAAALVSILRL